MSVASLRFSPGTDDGAGAKVGERIILKQYAKKEEIGSNLKRT